MIDDILAESDAHPYERRTIRNRVKQMRQNYSAEDSPEMPADIKQIIQMYESREALACAAERVAASENVLNMEREALDKDLVNLSKEGCNYRSDTKKAIWDRALLDCASDIVSGSGTVRTFFGWLLPWVSHPCPSPAAKAIADFSEESGFNPLHPIPEALDGSPADHANNTKQAFFKFFWTKLINDLDYGKKPFVTDAFLQAEVWFTGAPPDSQIGEALSGACTWSLRLIRATLCILQAKAMDNAEEFEDFVEAARAANESVDGKAYQILRDNGFTKPILLDIKKVKATHQAALMNANAAEDFLGRRES